MKFTRRTILRASIATAITSAVGEPSTKGDEAAVSPIIDTHQHMWDLSRQKLPWLENAEPILRQSYGPVEYGKATAELSVRAIYMEVDVAPEQRDAEAVYVAALCRGESSLTRAAVIGGMPGEPGFADYIRRHAASGVVRGVRHVLFSTPPDMFLGDEFLAGIRLLGKLGLSFDLCLPATLLSQGTKLCERASDTRFVLDHCGNADVKAFQQAGSANRSHDPNAWKRDMELIAKRPNVICKISGIIASAPEQWAPELLVPIVDHCLDTFGPERVVFGGDWPVCLKRATLRQWIDALAQIIAKRPKDQRDKLWWKNAEKWYAVEK